MRCIMRGGTDESASGTPAGQHPPALQAGMSAGLLLPGHRTVSPLCSGELAFHQLQFELDLMQHGLHD